MMSQEFPAGYHRRWIFVELAAAACLLNPKFPEVIWGFWGSALSGISGSLWKTSLWSELPVATKTYFVKPQFPCRFWGFISGWGFPPAAPHLRRAVASSRHQIAAGSASGAAISVARRCHARSVLNFRLRPQLHTCLCSTSGTALSFTPVLRSASGIALSVARICTPRRALPSVSHVYVFSLGRRPQHHTY